MFVSNKVNSRINRIGFPLFGGRPWRPQDAFVNTPNATQLGPYRPGYFWSDAGITPAIPLGFLGRIGDQTGNGYNANQTGADSLKPRLGNISVGGIINRFLNSDTLSTQNVTTRAVEYTISFKGTGTITLTGTSTDGPLVGTGVNDRVSLTFTPTAGALTCTVSGSCTEAQIQFGAAFTVYQRKTTAYDATTAGVPTLQVPYYPGTAWMTLGVESVGTADLFFEAGKPQWLLVAWCKPVDSVGNVIAKGGAVEADRTFSLGTSTSTIGNVIVRGSATAIAFSDTPINLHAALVYWDGDTGFAYIDDISPVTLNIGVSTTNDQNILIGARTESSPAGFWVGFAELVGIRAGSLTAGQIQQLRQWMNQHYRGVSI